MKLTWTRNEVKELIMGLLDLSELEAEKILSDE